MGGQEAFVRERAWRVMALGWVAAAVSAGGCYFERSGSEGRMLRAPELTAPGAWPETPQRLLDEVEWASQDTTRLGPAPAGEFLAALGAPAGGGWREAWRGELPAERMASLRTPVGLVRVRVTRDGRPLDAPGDLMALFRGFTANGWVQTGLSFGSGAEAMSAALTGASRLEGRGEGGGWCAPTVVMEERAPAEAGIPIRIPPTIAARPRGVILHLWALMSNPYEQEVMAEFAARGWVVVDIDTLTGVAADVEEGDLERAADLQRRIVRVRAGMPAWDGKSSYEEFAARRRGTAEAAELERLEGELDAMRRPATVVRDEAGARAAGARMAGQIDRTLATNAYAAEAALTAVHTVYPQTGALPTVVMGFSAGALSAPTVAARLRGRVSAVVIVGGAANLLETAERSELTDGGLRLEGRELTAGERMRPKRERPGGLSAGLLRAASAAYLEHSRLDPYHTAAGLYGVPVLQVHAVWDTWVPAANGELLTERLGGPERLVMPGGHGMLFYFLPKRKGWLADWVEAHAPAGVR